MQRWGTNFIYGVTNTTGLVRTRNFQYNQLPDSEDIECENLDKYSIGMDGCFGCQAHCRHRYVIKEGPYAGTYAQGPEYTSQGAFGTDGLKLEWGNDEAVLEMVKRIAFREGLGDVLAEGPLRAVEKIGAESQQYLIHVKGMSNLHSDERATPSLALNIAVASRGAEIVF